MSEHMPGCASIECRICGDPMDRHAELNIARVRFHAGVAADCDCELGELRTQRDELVEALEELVDAYIRNQGTEHEFVSCITPKGIPDYWQKARAVLKKVKR